jgi:hypothetical protein
LDAHLTQSFATSLLLVVGSCISATLIIIMVQHPRSRILRCGEQLWRSTMTRSNRGSYEVAKYEDHEEAKGTGPRHTHPYPWYPQRSLTSTDRVFGRSYANPNTAIYPTWWRGLGISVPNRRQWQSDRFIL